MRSGESEGRLLLGGTGLLYYCETSIEDHPRIRHLGELLGESKSVMMSSVNLKEGLWWETFLNVNMPLSVASHTFWDWCSGDVALRVFSQI